jgi:hypothetical protein
VVIKAGETLTEDEIKAFARAPSGTATRCIIFDSVEWTGKIEAQTGKSFETTSAKKYAKTA